MRVIRFTVNGQPVEAKAKDKQSLLSFLREELKLTGTKTVVVPVIAGPVR